MEKTFHNMNVQELLLLSRDTTSRRRRDLARYVLNQCEMFDRHNDQYPVWLEGCLENLNHEIESLNAEREERGVELRMGA